VTDNNNNLVQQIQEHVAIGVEKSSKRLPVLGVHNAEFTPLNPEIAAPYQSSTLNVMKALENTDSIELKSIYEEMNKQTKNQILEKNMTKLIDENCGCPKRQTKTEELNELDDKINDSIEITGPYIHASDVQAAKSMITNQDVATKSSCWSRSIPRAVETDST